MKKCSTCKEFKEEVEFYKCLSKWDGLQGSCKLCQYKKGTTERGRQSSRKSKLKTLYNITQSTYDYFVEKQEGRCAICLEQRPLCIDHDHRNGRFRGLLCDFCNKGLGMFRDNFIIAENAANYLRTT